MLMKADIEKLRDALPSILSSTNLKKESKKSLCGPCPKCSGDDRFVYRTDSGKCFCRKCHPKSMDVIDFHQWITGKTLHELLSEYGLSSIKDKTPPDIKTLFCDQRGIAPGTINGLAIGQKYHAGKPSAEIPYTDFENSVLATQFLTLDQKPYPLTLNGKPAKKVFLKGSKPGAECFFQCGTSIRDAKVVVISESVINAITAVEAIPGICSLATGGSTYTKKIKALEPFLKGIDKIIVCQDNDDAGRKMAQEIYKILGKKTCSIQWQDSDKKGYDINDLLMAGQKERILSMIADAGHVKESVKQLQQQPEPWEPPVMLKDKTAPPLKAEYLPGLLGEYAQAVSIETETPLELAVGMILAAVSASIHGKFIVNIRAGYNEPTNLWILTALAPGNRKSAVLKKISQPLTEWEHLEHSRLQPVIEIARNQRKNQEARIKSLRARYGKAKQKDLKQIEDEILEIQQNLIFVLEYPRVWAQDITPENLGTLLSHHEEKMAILSSEGGIFDIMGGRYSGGSPNFDIFLQSHAGDSVRVDRGSRDLVYLDAPSLVMGLTLQPSVLQNLTRQSSFRGRGLLGRFLYLLPESNLGCRNLETEPVNPHLQVQYNNSIAQLLDIEKEDNPFVLSLSPAAYAIWLEFSRALEPEMAEGGRFEFLTDWASKLPGAAVRLAGVLHCSQHPEASNGVIDAKTMGQSLDIAAILSEHALIAFDLMGADESLESAKKVWKWIKRGRYKEFKKRDCFNALKGSFHRVEKIEEPLKILIERSYLRSITKKTGGRPSIVYSVNPDLAKGWE